MPFVRISLRRGRPGPYRKAIANGVYDAMRETFGVPDEDRFVVIHEHEDDDFVFSPTYLDVQRSTNLVIVQITANDTRSTDQKTALYAEIARRLGHDPGVRPEVVLINIVEVAKENWSFGNGVAQYA